MTFRKRLKSKRTTTLSGWPAFEAARRALPPLPLDQYQAQLEALAARLGLDLKERGDLEKRRHG